MKLRKFLRGVIFSSLTVILISSSVLATDLDDKNRISLDQFSEEEQNKIIQTLNDAGMADAIEEEHVELADEADEIESVRMVSALKMNNHAQRKAYLSLDSIEPFTEEEKEAMENGTYEEEVIVSSSSAKKEINPTTIKATTIKEVPQVTDEEVKADFRYSLTSAQQKKTNGYLNTNYMNNALKMRIQLEKMFDTKVDANGGLGKLYYYYFAGSTGTDKSTGCTTYARAFVHSQFSKDLENNKELLAKLAGETFADIDGTESYAYLIPTSVYYGLIDVETVTKEKAASSNGKYKEGDLLCHAKDNVTYAKLSKLTEGYDGFKRHATSGKLAGTEYAHMDNLTVCSVDTSIMTKEIANKNVVKGELIEQLMRQSYLIQYTARYENDNIQALAKTFKDTSKFIEPSGIGTAAQWRALYMNCIANPSKGVPSPMGFALVGAKKAGISITDSKGNTNWNKPISLGESLKLFYQAARVDE